MGIFRFLSIVILFIVSGCAPHTQVYGDSIYTSHSLLVGTDYYDALAEAAKLCGNGKRPVVTSHNPGIWLYSETTFKCEKIDYDAPLDSYKSHN